MSAKIMPKFCAYLNRWQSPVIWRRKPSSPAYILTALACRKITNKPRCGFPKLADGGHALSCNTLGELYAEGLGVDQNYAVAAKWFQKAADQSEAKAQHALGLLHEKKLITDADPQKAAEYYKLAAAQGLAKAQVSLGVLYQQGEITPQDYGRAREWYQKAAAQNHPRAQNNLGILYTKALGVEQDYQEAAKVLPPRRRKWPAHRHDKFRRAL